MGRISELLEKKIAKTITEEEQKELDSLLAEAKAVDGGEENNEEKKDDEENDEEVEKAAQALADSVTEKISENTAQLTKVLEIMKKGAPTVEVKDSSKGFVVDKKLGKKSVEELAEIKIAMPDREARGKKVTEVSMKTAHFLNALMTGNKEKLQLLSEGTGADGGVLVPEEFANMIVEDIRDLAVMRNLANVMQVNTDTVHIPSLVSRPKAAWRAEKAVKNTSTATFDEVTLTPYSLAAIVGLSNELVSDAALGVGGSIINYISQLMAQSLSEAEEKAFWTGSGSTQPTGVTQYTVRTVASGLTDTSRADSIIQAFHRTPQGYRNRGVWVGNAGTWEKVATLKDSQNNYLLSSLGNGPSLTLRGRPIYEQNDLPGGTLFYGDFSYYQIADREGISVRVSDEATVAGSSAFEKNLTYVRTEKRVDGELLLPAAVTKVTGLGTP